MSPATNVQNAHPFAGTAKPYIDVRTEEYVIPAGTTVIAECTLDGVVRSEQTTKHEHRFLGSGRQYNGENSDEYYQFATGNWIWPYMYVSKSLFHARSVIEKDNKKAKKTKTLPPLTKKQTKRMQKKSKCPDCGNDSWLGGPCGGGSQNLTCKDCGSKFNITPFGIERI